MKEEIVVVYNENSLDSKLTRIIDDITKISKDVDAIRTDTRQIKTFIGFTDVPSDANPDIHRKFHGLFNRIDKLEHFKTHVNTGVTLLGFLIGICIAVYAYI